VGADRIEVLRFADPSDGGVLRYVTLGMSARPMADPHLPAEALVMASFERSRKPLELPVKWDPELAHYLGWVVGDGCIDNRDNAAVTVYGSAEDKEIVMPRHHALLTQITGFESKPSVQANGTLQLRVTRRAFGEFLRGLGVSGGRAAEKTREAAPW